ncbi:SusC/RagA family TonB-linked outer membrane protein [Dyadobacter bucti]|jgi:TonB-linked SusC/RagA family outer membrane protein|uniref:SusC/RagA family TonB-linked outer membrane protein n=1 Tax=Dyadobacter bucti TaxID=2572203 RepID=UPI001108E28E|nr:TonB-dependent receptor [Dyadobacter bucti]
MMNLSFLEFRGRNLFINNPARKRSSATGSGFLEVLLVLMIITSAVSAQDVKVSGKVSDGKGTGLPGVSITVKGTTTGTNSDMDGNYAISAPSSATLVFSFIGFTTKEVLIGNQSKLDVELSDDIKALEEVVVVGYGTAKRKDVTGSVQSVTSKDFNAGVNPNPLQAIQGRVAGLVITQPNGDPNTSPTVRLRGYTSLAGGSDPLYVVDGIIGVPITTISPTDIETMDVLKDASASAIYGSRAANGVIIITTKRGKTGRATVTFNNYVGVDVISNNLKLLDGPGYMSEVSRIKGDSSLLDSQRFPKDASGKNYNTDWWDEISRSGFTNSHDLAISGGSPTFSYRGSLNYIKRQGIIKNTGFDRTTARINLDQKALDNRLNIQYSLSYTNTNSDLTDPGILVNATLFLPTLPVRNANGSFYEVPGAFDLNNPMAMLANETFERQKNVLVGGVNLKYELFSGFTLGVNGAIKSDQEVTSRARDRSVKAFQITNGEASRNLGQTNDKLLELTATYVKGFGDKGSNFSLLGGYSYQDIIDDGFGANNSQFVATGLGFNNLGLGAGSLILPKTSYTSSYKRRTSLASFFGRGTLNFNEKYNLTGTLRYDGSSKFGDNNKWGLFPSVAAGWTLSDESFFPKSNAFNYLKLRASWGKTGNSEGLIPYQSLQLYGPTTSYYDGGINNFLPGYAITQNTNPNLKWEVVAQTNLGLDFQFVNGRFTGSIDLFNKKTSDMLYRYSVPADGVKFFTNSIYANVGSMRNKGIELSFGGAVIEKDNFNWTSRVVGSYIKNEIINLKSDEFDSGIIRFNAFGGRGLSNVFASILTPGLALGTFNNVGHFVGFDEKGQMQLQAADDGAPVTDPAKAKLNFKDNPQPFLTAAWVNNFTYKKFDLSFQFRGVFGNSILNNLRSNLSIPGSILETNMLQSVSELPANFSTNALSDYWLEKATYVRLDNWQVGYNLAMDSKYITNARIYLGGNNLLIFTKYRGVDPELEVKGDLPTNSQTPNSLGLDATGIYPKTRTFQLGVNLTF